MECIVECFRCYYIERKLGAIVCALVVFLGCFFGLKTTTFLTPTTKSILAIVFGVAVGNIFYVVTSESFCNWCSSCRQGTPQNAFAPHARIHV